MCCHLQELQNQLYDAEAQAREKGRQKDREVDDLRRRLGEAETQADQSRPELDAKQREIDVIVMCLSMTCTCIMYVVVIDTRNSHYIFSQRLSQALSDRDEELSWLRSQLKEKDDSLSHARKSTHTASMENKQVYTIYKTIYMRTW